MDTRRKNILLAMDGSDQSPETVRYVGRLFPGGRAKLTLFHVMDLLPKNFSDYSAGPDPRYEVSGVRQWEFDQMGRVEVFMEQAVRLLIGMGYRREDVTVIVRDRTSDIVRDLAQEGRNRGYDAVVAGHSTVSLMKTLPLESLSERLVTLLGRLPPIWIVGGSPDATKVLIAMDSSKGAGRALDYVGKIFPDAYPEILLLHVSRRMGMLEPEFGPFDVVHEGREWMERSNADLRLGVGGMESYLQECVAKIDRKGMDRDRIKAKTVHEAKSVSEVIMKEALDGDYGTIVLGRRDRSRIDEMIQSSMSNMILHLAKEKAVWVVH